jgi:16S rRNA (cytosine1402-N4)-methyltransferase
MEEIYHIPAMLKETIEGLAIKPDGVYVDVTFGGGGHSRAIMKDLHDGGKLFSFDQDIEAYQNAVERGFMLHAEEETKGEDEKNAETKREKEEKWVFVHANFRYLKNWMDYYGVEEIDGLLADLGVSFHHFDCPERGFSFRFSALLDMRMNQTGKRTAADVVNGYSEEELAKLFWLYGEMKNGRAIARNIVKARAQKPIERTEELVALLAKGIQVMPNGEIEVPTQYKKDLARMFQALRIEVNDEMGALREMLVAARDLLKPGGRIVILTYHSLEDRLVKNFLRSGNLEGTIEKDFYGNALTPFDVIEKGRVASDDEVERNPRSRSAKLRVAERKAKP